MHPVSLGIVARGRAALAPCPILHIAVTPRPGEKGADRALPAGHERFDQRVVAVHRHAEGDGACPRIYLAKRSAFELVPIGGHGYLRSDDEPRLATVGVSNQQGASRCFESVVAAPKIIGFALFVERLP